MMMNRRLKTNPDEVLIGLVSVSDRASDGAGIGEVLGEPRQHRESYESGAEHLHKQHLGLSCSESKELKQSRRSEQETDGKQCADNRIQYEECAKLHGFLLA